MNIVGSTNLEEKLQVEMSYEELVVIYALIGTFNDLTARETLDKVSSIPLGVSENIGDKVARRIHADARELLIPKGFVR